MRLLILLLLITVVSCNKLYIQKHDLVPLKADEFYNFQWNDRTWLRDDYQVHITMLKGKINLYETEFKEHAIEITDTYEITVDPGSALFITAKEESLFQIGTYSDTGNSSGLQSFVEVASIFSLVVIGFLSWVAIITFSIWITVVLGNII